ncbi:PglZ domain-containing protein [Mucilaginibacter gossypiicola]|uniref:PglZ domain-containing protein n=1 Tax=Mucilaginibacter gossypiicola TaxID=551995 RepID=A0A1H8D9F8_9SPHI|nr:BREX-3 system phosphatase PglZ [Mucilaginibacter gossypiicola]SEN03981.1 PglZ domain-containing protein [Mucilaginibacter gossypiicola]
MNNWIDKYKKLAISSHKQHILIADQDNLFTYLELKEAFENEGYTIIICPNALSVRVHFELQVRETTGRFLMVAPEGYVPLPDIETHVHFQSIGLFTIFPNLDAKAIKGLGFNALCLLANIKPYEELGHEKTLRFLLENLYSIDFNTLTSSKAKERVMNALINVFFEKDGINEPLTIFLTHLSKPYFPTLIAQDLTQSRLLNFIKEQWQQFIEGKSSLLDFAEPSLNKNIGYLFAFGYLDPLQVSPEKYDSFPKPLRIGIYVDAALSNDNELEGLTEYLNQQMEVIEDLADQWFKIIQVLSQAKLKSLESHNASLKLAYLKVEQALNYRFQRFIDNTYNSLFSLSGVRQPVMVTRILEHINARSAKKKALLVIDGMNYWQWTILGKALLTSGLNFSSNASLAFVPTITAWSRQAIFKGAKPDLLEDNSHEGKLFKAYWLKQHVPAFQIDLRKISVHAPLIATDIPTDVTVLGLICNDLDNIMHGAVLGEQQLKTSTEQWIQQSRIVQIVAQLKTLGFQIFITADHGNVEARGVKNLSINDKVGSLSRGKRHLHFTNETLLENFVLQNSSLTLGRKDLSVYLKANEAFTLENTRVITHGGSHLWEVIVPFISINE